LWAQNKNIFFFNLCISDHTVSRGSMVSEQWIRKDEASRNHGLISDTVLIFARKD